MWAYPGHGYPGEKDKLQATVCSASSASALQTNYRIYRQMGQLNKRMAAAYPVWAEWLKLITTGQHGTNKAAYTKDLQYFLMK